MHSELSGSLPAGAKYAPNLTTVVMMDTRLDFTAEDLHWGPHLKNALLINSGLRGSFSNGIFDNATALETLKLTTETPLMKTLPLAMGDTLHPGISGTIPDALFAHAAQLQIIEITHNRALSGTIPVSIESLPSLVILLLHDQVWYSSQ